MPKMDLSRLKSLVAAEVQSALGYVSNDIATEREEAMNYYLGEPFGNEVEGRSKVISREVMDTIEWIKPALLKIFASGEKVVKFEPEGPEDVPVATQAEEYVNWIFTRDNRGFNLFYSWFTDALLQKVGVLKVYWDEIKDVSEEEYEGLTEAEVMVLAQDPEVKIVKAEPATRDEMPLLDPMGGQLFDVEVKRTKDASRVRVEGVPPEEFLISRKARGDVQEAPFVAHRVRKTKSDLVAMGFDRDLVDSLGSGDDYDPNGEAVARDESQGGLHDDMEQGSRDPALDEIVLNECYIRADMDGDGIAELVQVFFAGNQILSHEEVDRVPFVTLTPIPMPHRFFGLSVADLVMDLQLIKSTVMRQVLDNMYLANNGRMAVVADQVNLDDLLKPTPGGVVRVRSQGAITPLVTAPLGPQAFGLMEYLDTIKENRTGVTRYNQGLDANSLNKTASGISQIMSAAQERILLIARVFAETGVKDLFKRIFELVCKHQQKARMIRLRGEFVPMDPRSWNSQMDLTISVGLGTGNKMEQLSSLQLIAAMQEKLVASGMSSMVTPQNIYNTLEKMVEAAGLKTADPYFTEPKGDQPPQAPGQSKGAEEEAKMKAELAKEQMRAAAQQQKAATDGQVTLEKQAMIERGKLEQIALKAQLEPRPMF